MKQLDSPWDAVLFDLDGTIVDTEPAAARVIEVCAKRWKVRVEESDIHSIAGVTWATAISRLREKYQIAIETDKMVEECLQVYRERLIENLVVVPGSVDLIRDLHGWVKIGLVSGSNRADIESILGHLKIRHLFELVLGCEDYEYSKPSPSGYLKAMVKLGVTGQKVLIFEDSNPGIQSGLHAGARVVAIEFANHWGHDQSKAHYRVKDLKCVTHEWLKSIFQSGA